MDHLLSKELYCGCSCTLWLVEYASVILPTFIIENCPGETHTQETSRVFEWRFVTHVVHAQLKSNCLYVGALLGVWGIIPLFCA